MDEATQLQVSLDKLPIKRLDSIEENGIERFPPDVDYDEKRLSLIRRIDFAWAIEKDEEKKKQKKSSKETSTPWQWQSMVENLQLAHQELTVIIDLINTVEANDAVTVASMTRPKLLPNEALSDQAVSAATKLQCYRHVGKYFKQSAKAFEQQVAREARFYGALIRLQQNWKVKRQRQAAIVPGNEGFTLDLFDSSYDQATIVRSLSTSTVRVNHDAAGMLAINVSPDLCHSLQFGFVGAQSEDIVRRKSNEDKSHFPGEHYLGETGKESSSDEECVKKTHSLLREVHQAIFNEQVFDLVNREAFNTSTGVSVTGIRENYLQLSLGQGTFVYLSLVSKSQDHPTVEGELTNNIENAVLPLESSDEMELDAKQNTPKKKGQFSNPICYEIYIQQIFHEHIFGRGSEKPITSGNRSSSIQAKDGSSLLGHFFMSLAHRIFSSKVLAELENLVCKVPYLQLVSNPTWHSRASSWTLFMEVPQSILRGSQVKTSDYYEKNAIKRQFWTKVVVNDDCINVTAEGSPNVAGLFKGKSEETHSINKYDCNLADLPVIILQQVASQIINWLYQEALMVGIKANRDFLCLSFELEQGETLGLVANVNPEDSEGCISWSLVMEYSFAEEQKLHMNITDGASEYRKFIGHLSLDLLYATLIDLVGLCSGGAGQ
ncbi:mediator of RNA polymerase II transcription subunit 17 [Abrus precatorius]|uniref:Mediator of RNA polymerase II transcription subunit 17 n=1 Tax=Abrus precatorius TaxID=3816 RepID=A0A8B8KCC5_ABRPR|nr:mediator of RNA polymerase II transcription subunit 17 [Abrus precatorius]XP_027341431.1 mediator of RNA polymerase II transcription subunit 17 [Abrus precatorius]